MSDSNPSTAGTTLPGTFAPAPAGSPHHELGRRLVAVLGDADTATALDVLISVYRHVALAHPAITATCAFSTAVLSKELADRAGLVSAPKANTKGQ